MLNGYPILVRGMHGLGDNLHQRAIVRDYLGRGHKIWLETPWPSVYHDLVGRQVRLVNTGSRLRTQAKNAEREAARYYVGGPPSGATIVTVRYTPAAVLAA